MKKIFYQKYSIGEILMLGYAWVFARRPFILFNKVLFHLSLRGLGVFNYQTFHISGERFLVQTLLPKLLPAEQDRVVLFDVGANEGKFAAELLAALPRASVYSFEPHKQTYLRLQKVMGDRCHVLNCGLGDVRGSMKLYDMGRHGDGTSFASLYPEVISDIHHGEVEAMDVEIRTLDDVADDLGVSRIDFVKIDTEGHEFAVLKGASRLLAEGKIGVIHFEFNAMNVVSRCFMRDFQKLLDGYRLFRLLPSSLLELVGPPALTEIFGFQNVVAIKGDHPYLKKRRT